MTKAILVLEMPNNCYQCPYCDCKDNYCVLCGESMETQGERQSWCPLKELPQKKEYTPLRIDDAFELVGSNAIRIQVGNVYIRGFNACLEEILGEEK